MTKIGFDRERLVRYFRGENTQKNEFYGSSYGTNESKLNNELTGDEPYVNKVFIADENEKDLKVLLSSQFDEITSDKDAEKENLDHILHKIHYDINTRLAVKKVRKIDTALKWTLRLAGVIILPIVIMLGIQQLKESKSQKLTWVEIKAPAWSKVQFSLPDGTTGWLNSNSTLKYNGSFTSQRLLTLNGEAYFDVFHDAKSEFVVTTNDIAVKVLGTRFNITSYENEKSIEVVLEEGKLIFQNNDGKKSYTMKPNDMVKYNKSKKDFTTEVVQSQKYISWIDGKLIFRNDPLDVVANKLERWYNVDVELKVDLSENLRLRATFIDENLVEVLDLMKRSMPIDYKIIEGAVNQDGTFNKKKVIITLKEK